MGASIVTLKLKLEAATKQDGDKWIAWCLPLDVLTQADSREAALAALEEAVALWFESCIERNVLGDALAEAGFVKAKPGEAIPEDTNLVQMNVHRVEQPSDFSSPEFIEVSIPAYIAARHLPDYCATR